MDLARLATSMKKLVDDYEKLIDKAIALKGADRGRYEVFISEATTLLQASKSILPEAKAVAGSYSSSDVLVKHISTYYRMIKYVSIRYLIDLMKETLQDSNLEQGVSARMHVLLAGFENLKDTL
ncbi:MAG: hypothetical protein OWQ48_05730 [Desulfurococcus sp.]|nr:hypothetical protein [Desulfurococcus sp.]